MAKARRRKNPPNRNFDLYIGIDPGKAGGVAYLFPGSNSGVAKIPETIGDLCSLLADITNESQKPFVYLERVWAGGNANARGNKMGATSAFSFGEGFGVLQGLLCGLAIPYELVLPNKWQKEYGLKRKANESDTDKKNRHKAVAQRLFPKLKVTHWNSDALLIAEYLRRVKEGEIW